MKNKLLFLTKMSLNKIIKTKWFLIANIIFAVLRDGKSFELRSPEEHRQNYKPQLTLIA